MTGIERLREIVRELGGISFCYDLYNRLVDIADQIEYEITPQEIRDEPADDHAEDVSVSAYDLLPEEDREAIAWVCDHGGLDHVRVEWRSRVPRDRYERRRQSLLGHIAECETALGRRNVRIEELGHRVNDLTRENAELRKRAMPDGCEWPRFESGELVNLGDRYKCWCGKTHVVSSVSVRKGCSVLNTSDVAHTFAVSDGPLTSHGKRVKRPAVPAADGKLLEAGQTVWDANGDELVIGAIEDGGHTVSCRYADIGDAIPVHGMWSPSDLTHARPEQDSWERIEEDADTLVDAEINGEGSYNAANAYCNRRGLGEGTSFVLMAQDLVRRCRALAERERGE